ncbi:hypothetical protein AGMMS49949_01340 [Alphaproteobacteria bacterium]|nr:hypothetical protein AGMMS49949_01340 [Alphaproteobacteria bacterium]GHS95686.1 hypothetical protein AGMMS50296_0590 [Alphaproteobacteria bacterium]
MVDPIFSATASPFLKAIPAFEGANIYAAEDFPAIDCLLITHDHYDHLDYKTVVALRPKVRQVVVPLGVGSHFRYWGYDPQHIRELNWYESFSLKNATITATPALHMSGRTLFLGRTLWASYLVHMGKYRLFFGGDGGYGEHFREIGEGRRGRAWTNKGNSQEAIFEGEGPGPIDLAFLENGQYNENWPKNHMFPEQTVQAAKDLKAKVFLPIHWGKFCLSEHFWNEPIQKLLTLADAAAQRVTVPKVGEVCRMDEADKRDPWWKF